ncbi:MAG TPA: DegT/DnrJ/EryC1/StrS family aminotransferase [Thermoleophilia bacterium]|nr:DegT/DnrJ/EryC1/StrS family aminotransferase [Thermoleophilia bacterium]
MSVDWSRPVAAWFGCEHAVPVGTGTAALYLVLRAAGVRGAAVVVPALTCPTVALAVLAAGATPLAVDVGPDDACLAPAAVAAALDHHPGRVAAIVGVDAFGLPADWPALHALADAAGCLLVEDACQSYGGRLGGRALGSFGDASVISFGYGKNVWLNGGGVVLTHDAALAADVRRLLRRSDVPALSDVRSRLYLRLVLRDRYRALRLASAAGLLDCAFPQRLAAAAGPAWERFVAALPATLEERRATLDALTGLEGVRPLRPADEAKAGDEWLPWRPSFAVAGGGDERRALVAALAAAGLPTSTLYDTLEAYLPEVVTHGDCTAARTLAATIVNLKLPASPGHEHARAGGPGAADSGGVDARSTAAQVRDALTAAGAVVAVGGGDRTA